MQTTRSTGQFLKEFAYFSLNCTRHFTTATAMLLLFCSMPVVDSRIEHELRQRSTKRCNERPSVPGSMPRQSRV